MTILTKPPAVTGHEPTMPISIPSRSVVLRLTSLLVLLSACGGPAATPATPNKPAMQISPEQLAVVDSFEIESGPSLSGTLSAERTAQVRSQLTGTVLAVRVREGQAVGAGQAIALIDTTVAAEQARSARSWFRSAQLAADVAARNEERSAALLKGGAIAERDHEAARSQALAAAAALADAASRLASAEKSLGDATVRAPFGGVISELPVSVGDVVQGGAGGATLLATVVDPSQLTLEASVPAEYLGAVKRGAKVEFRLNGAGGVTVMGTVDRINPAVDGVTRQVRIYVAVPNRGGDLASGLFAEGRVTLMATRGLAIPFSALDPAAPAPVVKRLRGGVVELVPVVPGLRDEMRERLVVTGLARGDTLLVGGAIGIPSGSSVRVTRADG